MSEASLLLICLIGASFGGIAGQHKTYKGFRLYEVSGEKAELQKFVKYVTDNYDSPFTERVGPKTLHVLISPEAAVRFEKSAQHLTIKILIEDYSEVVKADYGSRGRNSKFSWDAYYDINDIYKFLRTTNKEYPNITEVIVGGQSYEGRQILGLRINTTPSSVQKPVMFIESGIHAREWIAPATTTYFINQLLTNNDPSIRAMRDNFDWRIFPSVNPDGYHYSHTVDRMWRKTRSRWYYVCYGADANRNWDYKWMQHGSSSNPCNYELYAGTKPFSEIETKSLSQYISSIEGLMGYVAFHSYAAKLLLPYSDSKEHFDNYDDLIYIGKKSIEYGRAVNNISYEEPGTAAELLYPSSGGSMDWVREKLRVPIVLAYELRGTTAFHWPPERIPEQGDEVTQMMLGLLVGAHELGYYGSTDSKKGGILNMINNFLNILVSMKKRLS